MVDPISQILVPLGIHAGTRAIDAISRWLESGPQEDSLHVSSSGQAIAHSGPLLSNYYVTPLVNVAIGFGTTDELLAELLDADTEAVLIVVAPSDNGDPTVDVVPCTLGDDFHAQLPAGEVALGAVVFDEDLVDEEGNPAIIAWQLLEAELYEDAQISIDIRPDETLLALAQAVVGSPVCDWCWAEDDVIASSWTIDTDGDYECQVCGSFNDFHECLRCGNAFFRHTRKGNFRCLQCNKKVVA